MFHLPLERIQLTAPDVGGGFGMKNFLSPEWVLVLWAARRLGRPVKWVAERIEEFVAGTQGRDNHTRARLALDEDSRFLGLDVSTVANLGRICRRTARAARPIRRRRQWAVSMRSRPYSWTCAAPLPTPCRSTPIAVQGGVAQGIGQALFEHTVYDPGSGQLLSGSRMDYTLPRADDLPPLTSPSPSCQLPPIRLASKARVRPAASRRRRPSSTQSSTRSRHSASNISTCRPLLSGSGVRSAECDGDHPQSWPLCRFDADPITRGSASWNRGRPNGGGPCGREL